MYILKRKTKNGLTYYLAKSYRDVNTKKNTSKIVEKIGTEEELKKKSNNNIDEWLKKYLNEYKSDEDEGKLNIQYNAHKKIHFNNRKYLNGGYFPIKKICNTLHLHNILSYVKKASGCDIELEKVVYSLLIDNIILHGKQDSYRAYSDSYIENIPFKNKDIRTAIKILSEYQTYIQLELFWSAYRTLKYDCSYLYNECKNYCYMFTKNGKNLFKVFQVDVFYDKKGLPVAYFHNSENNYELDQPDVLYDLLTRLDEVDAIFYSSNMLPSKIIKKMQKDSINVQTLGDMSIRKLSQNVQNIILNDEEWKVVGKDKTVNIHKLIEENPDSKLVKKTRDFVFYKSFNVTINDKSKQLIAVYNGRQRELDRKARYTKYVQIKSLLDKNIIKNSDKKALSNDIFKKVQNLLKYDNESDSVYDFDNDRLEKDLIFDGFDTMIIDQQVKDIENIIKVRMMNAETNDCFQTIKDEYSILPKSINMDVGVRAHMLINYISLLIIKTIQYKSKRRFSINQILTEMAFHDFIQVNGVGWIPIFSPNKTTKFLDKMCNIETDYEILTEKKMKEITKKLNKKV